MRCALGFLEKTIDMLTTIGAVVGGVFTGVMTIIVGYAVVGRYVFNFFTGINSLISDSQYFGGYIRSEDGRPKPFFQAVNGKGVRFFAA